ncbi:MAG TPA: tRNA (adenosine(37)-N6)-threonylcarbamoyltransferase complex dimerization subunit type 1 TsaB [Pyrinomonadaceae bacterium]|nr:tRNA (adenosine(37)-N6)-threonylcarbamoyltransferase complex dimerization subunit type 1 TsaB [Pyrinomonadaceae bacterium]
MSIQADNICLALETAVGTGSIAILRSGRVVAESTHEMRPSRAEELLGVVNSVMSEANVSLSDLSLLAVSIGPGSYSGIRIGISTAIGLKNALSIECRGVSLLEAIAYRSIGSHPEIVAAVPVGKNDVAWQRFTLSNGRASESAKPNLTSIQDFENEVRDIDPHAIRAPIDVLQRIGIDGSSPANGDTTFAALVGKVAIENSANGSLTPIYLRSGTGF